MSKIKKTYHLSKAEKRLLRQICALYDTRVIFSGHHGFGGWMGDHILIGPQSNFSDVAIAFSHELAHVVNWKTGRYPIYHNPKNFGNMNKFFKSISGLAHYSLQAEIYTDKVGKKICKDWFPGITYKTTYKNDRWCKGFMLGHLS